MKQLFHTRVWMVQRISVMVLGIMRPTRRGRAKSTKPGEHQTSKHKQPAKEGVTRRWGTCGSTRWRCDRGVEGNSHSSSKESGQTVFRSIFSTFVYNHTSLCGCGSIWLEHLDSAVLHSSCKASTLLSWNHFCGASAAFLGTFVLLVNKDNCSVS